MGRSINTTVDTDQNTLLGPQVCLLLKQGIIQADFQPGYWAFEVEIASQSGISKQPVSEAFVRVQDAQPIEQQTNNVNAIALETSALAVQHMHHHLREFPISLPIIIREYPEFLTWRTNSSPKHQL